MKRAVDLLIAIVASVVLAPVMIAVAVAVRIRLGRPILYRQMRPGLHGLPFEVVKFRTMHLGEQPDELRLDAFGRFLRSTSLDELPELLNVIRGDMSLVGPRPLLEEYLPLYDERQATRHSVRPGLTGLAQVSGRNALSWDDRLELDAKYVERRSMRLDLQIMLRTIGKIIRREDITEAGEATMSKFTGSST